MSPLERIEQLLLCGLVVFAGIVLLVFFLRRALWRMNRRGWVSYSGSQPTYGTLGNAFLELQAITQPEKQHILEVKRKQKKDDQDEGGPDDPTRHLRRRRKRTQRKKRNQGRRSNAS